MNIRPAQKKDLPSILHLLSQVLELHAALRPDVFVSGTTKYSAEQLAGMLDKPKAPIYVAVDEADGVLGYAFCVLREQPFSTNMVPFTSLFIDDLCVDASVRGLGVGKALFEFVKQKARDWGCYEVTLNLWAGNDGASAFYERMGMRVKECQMELILEETP